MAGEGGKGERKGAERGGRERGRDGEGGEGKGWGAARGGGGRCTKSHRRLNTVQRSYVMGLWNTHIPKRAASLNRLETNIAEK